MREARMFTRTTKVSPVISVRRKDAHSLNNDLGKQGGNWRALLRDALNEVHAEAVPEKIARAENGYYRFLSLP